MGIQVNSSTTEVGANSIDPIADLNEQVESVLSHAVDGFRKDIKVYESLRNLNEVIGAEYGNRVLYELIQNAHDAHLTENKGKIAIKLIIRAENDGELHIANEGHGFRKKDVEAVKNIAISAKEVGEGIGNKGLGFRSIEALSSNVQIYSQQGTNKSKRFQGYCFRFATEDEIDDKLWNYESEESKRRQIAKTIPRYLLPLPITAQSKEIASYALRGYATVVVLPLQSTEAVKLASEQIESIANLDVPLLLFLERISKVRIEILKKGDRIFHHRLTRREKFLGEIASLDGSALHEVTVGRNHRYLVVKRQIEKQRVLSAVRSSLASAPQLNRWLNWKGTPELSVAVSLVRDKLPIGRLYNFLPMGEEAKAPFRGYLDAPFFSEIDRRNADLKLPLNELMIEVAAETCAATTIFIVNCDLKLPSWAVFDLFAWTKKYLGSLDRAFKELGSELNQATVVPTTHVNSSSKWANITQVKLWPDEKFAVLTEQNIVKFVGVNLVAKELGNDRISRLREIVKSRSGYGYRAGELVKFNVSLDPTGRDLAKWMEEFAKELISSKAALSNWSKFYNDIPKLFDACGQSLNQLNAVEIFLNRKNKLQPAGSYKKQTWKGVYVRNEMPKGKRKKAGVPLPPSKISRRYQFLNEKIKLNQATLNSYIEAELIREYDPIEALSGLKSALGAESTDARKKDALIWAFKVWQTADQKIDKEIKEIKLEVPTISGWQPATSTVFSSSWTSIGKILEHFLVETAEFSADCKGARSNMLCGQEVWPVSTKNTKRDWLRFLETIGVAEGLQPIPARICNASTQWGSFWNHLFSDGNKSEGLDEDWCSEVEGITVNHPNTHYGLSDEVWRLPGQIEHHEFSDSAKEIFCSLIFEHLKACGNRHFQFTVGRFERYASQVDSRELPTPLASFIRTKEWVSVNTRHGIAFRKPETCWASQIRRGGVPRFMEQVSDNMFDFSDSELFEELVFSDEVRLRDWQNKFTAVDRLHDLSEVSAQLANSDRPVERKEYQRAWSEVVENSLTVPPNLRLLVLRRGQIEVTSGLPEAPIEIIVTQSAQKFEARLLSEAGYSVLEVGEVSVEQVAESLNSIGSYKCRLIDGGGVHFLVDGEEFFPKSSDPTLVSRGLEWLPEVIIIGNEIIGEQLERGIQSSTIDRRIRSIRIRRCDNIALVVEGMQVHDTEQLKFFSFEHEEYPTLILTKNFPINWKTLADDLCDELVRLIDARLRSSRLILARLAMQLEPSLLSPPNDNLLARSLKCDERTVRQHREALWTNLDRVLHMLIPVVAYIANVDLAQQLEREVEKGRTKFNLLEWLEANLSKELRFSHNTLVDVCEKVADRSELYKKLNLNYQKFNRTLVELHEPTLSNRAELKRQYEAYLNERRFEVLERLRHHYYETFKNEGDLDEYIARKKMDFIEFNENWVFTHETLDKDVVDSHISSLLDHVLGHDTSVSLAPLKRVLETNRKTVRDFVAKASPVVGAWCKRMNVAIPEPWVTMIAQDIARRIENSGLFDFEILELDRLPVICARCSCWPDGMLQTLDEESLDLGRGEVEREKNRREIERQQREKRKRSIDFAGESLDTGDPQFSGTLLGKVNEYLSESSKWFTRSRRQPRLNEFEYEQRATGSPNIPHYPRPNGSRGKRLSDAQRMAMGQVSELVALDYLKRKHGEIVDEECWISENRSKFFCGNKGDDTAGYDFLVKTPQADWLYEVKSSLEDSCEFELTANEIRIASTAFKDGKSRYRILYVPFVFSPDKWYVLQLPNPMGEKTRNKFIEVRKGSVRYRFERS